ncbi:MAG: TlpA family protein disulfide reductase [Corynebacterium sp.]|uniref:Effector protein n=2 Tax=Corynebacterium TaxID=1716 RepID=A0A177ICM4_9CORY|nr:MULTISPECIES: TlpA disulfide reductase family protein [Corynebacterium]NWO16660.1 TlpA family protein disulfide reductase [Corynebacterium sp.]OAH26580.1 effector protein [Corynebacterium stationis]
MFASKRLASAVLIAAASVVLASCAQDSENAQNAVATGATFEFITPGGQQEIFYDEVDRKPLQSFSGESLMDESETISLDDYEGQIVVLNSWGQWCAPCRAEVDDLQRIQEDLEERDLGTVLGINVRDYNPQIARDFKEDNGVTFPSIYDPPFRTAAALGGVPTSVVPTTIVLDSQHRPAAVFLRGITDKEITEVVDSLEQEQASK